MKVYAALAQPMSSGLLVKCDRRIPTDFKREKNITRWYNLKGISVEGRVVSTGEALRLVSLAPRRSELLMPHISAVGIPSTSWPPPKLTLGNVIFGHTP